MDTATKDGGHTWTFGNQIWQQTPDGRFSLHSIAGVKTSDTRIDLDYLAGARLPAESSSDYLPAAFRFCPQSGQELLPARGDRRNRWLPPYGNGSGLRVIADGELSAAQRIVGAIFQRLQADGSPDLSRHSRDIDIQPLGKNGLNFFVGDAGGYRDALFALSRNGALYLWLRDAEKWQQLQPSGMPIGQIELERWAWSVSLVPGQRGHDLLIPGARAAVLVSVDPLNGIYRCRHYQGASLAGAALLADIHWMPLRMEDGSVQLVGCNGDGWKALPVNEVVLKKSKGLSAPISDPTTGRVLWIGEYGYLSLSQDDLKPHWQAWNNSATAMPQMGPPFRDGYGLWQLVAESESLVYQPLDPRSTQPSRSVKGYRLGTGHLSFNNNIRLEEPWNLHDENLERKTRDVVLPFLEFSGQSLLLSMRAEQSLPLDEFFQVTQKVLVQYRLEAIGGKFLSMDATVSKPWEVQWFFFDEAMWLYIDSSGELFRWDVV